MVVWAVIQTGHKPETACFKTKNTSYLAKNPQIYQVQS